ncbi:50S ribosomal protein L24 [Ephemerocybe angulata]|uniref:50S ribosomal protein L24 n=1 Tax=Ephemerocybe angulata TaxID=980116 RepID=A0A8H6IAL2_9AGAR|nr:50S ribosomal protein L24 [Tulosesus angulatus]
MFGTLARLGEFSQPFKQAQFGLRSWLPNKMRVKVTTRALRTIKKYGGVDNYLTKTPAHKLSHEGMKLRLKVKDALKENEAKKKTVSEGTQEATSPSSVWSLRSSALHYQVKKVATLLEEPTLEGARKARRQVATAMGLRKTLPSAKETMQYFVEQRQL